MKICVTFDVDLVNYLNWETNLEMETAFPSICEILSEFPEIQTTWFLRIDSQVETIFENAEHIFNKYKKEITWLRENGHEIGWHHHCYKYSQDRWLPDNNVENVLKQLKKYAPLAINQGLNISRMGWGTQSPAITDFLEESGFIVDSSAIPRPVYPWDKGLKDWENSPTEPFYPAHGTYKTKGLTRRLLQVPISTVELPFYQDTIPNVIRYINPAYHTSIFKYAIESYKGSILTTITHPYEIIPHEITVKSPLAFSLDVFKENLSYLNSLSGVSFITISELKKITF